MLHKIQKQQVSHDTIKQILRPNSSETHLMETRKMPVCCVKKTLAFSIQNHVWRNCSPEKTNQFATPKCVIWWEISKFKILDWHKRIICLNVLKHQPQSTQPGWFGRQLFFGIRNDVRMVASSCSNA